MHNKKNFKLMLSELMILLVMISSWNFYLGNFDKISTIDSNIKQAIDEGFVQIFDGETLKTGMAMQLIGVQVDAGPPMKVEYRNIGIKKN